MVLSHPNHRLLNPLRLSLKTSQHCSIVDLSLFILTMPACLSWTCPTLSFCHCFIPLQFHQVDLIWIPSILESHWDPLDASMPSCNSDSLVLSSGSLEQERCTSRVSPVSLSASLCIQSWDTSFSVLEEWTTSSLFAWLPSLASGCLSLLHSVLVYILVWVTHSDP